MSWRAYVRERWIWHPGCVPSSKRWMNWATSHRFVTWPSTTLLLCGLGHLVEVHLVLITEYYQTQKGIIDVKIENGGTSKRGEHLSFTRSLFLSFAWFVLGLNQACEYKLMNDYSIWCSATSLAVHLTSASVFITASWQEHFRRLRWQSIFTYLKHMCNAWGLPHSHQWTLKVENLQYVEPYLVPLDQLW